MTHDAGATPPAADGMAASARATGGTDAQAAAPRVILHVPVPLRVGEAATFTVVVENPTRAPVSLYLRGREPTADLVIEQDGAPLWRYLERDVVPAIIGVRTLAPGGSLTIRIPWDGRVSGGVPTPGRYQARAQLLTDAIAPPLTAPVEFSITPR